MADGYEYIGKVKLDYTLYSGTDLYSDGDIEDEILNKLAAGVSERELLECDDRWPVVYHFSSLRKNILEWYPFEKNATVLEVGAGCGAITGVLCQKARQVKAVDLSQKRCRINAHRNSSFDNLEIIVANFQDLKLTQKFNYITLIGVLEYAMAYMDHGIDSFKILLENVKSMLEENGKIVIAIENRLGLKYWNGAGEDHTGRIFEGIEGYPQFGEIKTFSKNELDHLLKEAGFQNRTFYYPYPDYKFPEQIFSDDYPLQRAMLMPQNGSYSENRFYFFDENAVRDTLIQAKLSQEFANSFLVIADM